METNGLDGPMTTTSALANAASTCGDGRAASIPT